VKPSPGRVSNAMNKRCTRNTAVLFLTLAAFVCGARAQSAPGLEEISEELTALVADRWDAIRLEAAGVTDDEWVGSYTSFDGPTISTQLAWSPAAGFIIWWENCSRPQTARVNYGSAAFAGGSLRLTPALTEQSPSSYPAASEYVPVRWGEQHYLIPSDEMINFAYAVHSTSAAEVETFLVKVGDYEKERKGLPDVPPEYRKYLGMKPLRAAASGFGPNGDRWYPKIILDAGRAGGVVRGMKFYLSRPGNVYMRLVVTDVGEHSSEAFVMTARFRDGREEKVRPKVGWEFTSRAPEDDSQYHP